MKQVEVIVIGGGIVGLWSAVHLAGEGANTLLLEQFECPHRKGSSHGASRGITHLMPEKERSLLMADCFKKWKELEKESKKDLLLPISSLNVFDMSKVECADIFTQLCTQRDMFAPHLKVIPGENVATEFPGLNYPSHFKILCDDEGGILNADLCLRALREIYLRKGGKSVMARK